MPENIDKKPVPASNVPNNRAQQKEQARELQFVEVEPGLIAWAPDGKFLWAQVNGQRTERPPILNRRGEWVYRVEIADLTQEEYERHLRDIERVRQIEVVPAMRNATSNTYTPPPPKIPKAPSNRFPGA